MKIHQYVQNSVLFAIGSAYDVVWRDLSTTLKKENCNLLQAMTLISIFFENSDRVTPSMLAESLNTTRANMSHCITHLEKRALLKRVLDSGDARSYRLVLKPEGRKLALRFIQVMDDLENVFEVGVGKTAVAGTISSLQKLEKAYLGR